ncbi:MAG: hypothetical protein WD075_05000 [Rhodospirillales bacterium]
MKPPETSHDETGRLEKLLGYEILDTEAEASFDRITRIVANCLNVPVSLISLIDAQRQWFKYPSSRYRKLPRPKRTPHGDMR